MAEEKKIQKEKAEIKEEKKVENANKHDLKKSTDGQVKQATDDIKQFPDVEKTIDKKPDKEEKKDEKKKDDKKAKIERPKKDKAVAKGSGIHVSMKQSMYICSFIKGKSIDRAISDLGEVIKLKKAVPFKGEIPHRKGMMSGRYPVNGSKEFITMLKGLKGNVSVNGMDLDKTRITLASATWARRPLRRSGRKAKRTNVILEAMEVKK